MIELQPYLSPCNDFFFFFSSRRRHTRWTGDWSSDVCSSDLHRGIHQSGQRRNVSGGGEAKARTLLTPKDQVHELRFSERGDRKSTRLNSSHPSISYAVFCLKKKKKNNHIEEIRDIIMNEQCY